MAEPHHTPDRGAESVDGDANSTPERDALERGFVASLRWLVAEGDTRGVRRIAVELRALREALTTLDETRTARDEQAKRAADLDKEVAAAIAMLGPGTSVNGNGSLVARLTRLRDRLKEDSDARRQLIVERDAWRSMTTLMTQTRAHVHELLEEAERGRDEMSSEVRTLRDQVLELQISREHAEQESRVATESLSALRERLQGWSGTVERALAQLSQSASDIVHEHPAAPSANAPQPEDLFARPMTPPGNRVVPPVRTPTPASAPVTIPEPVQTPTPVHTPIHASMHTPVHASEIIDEHAPSVTPLAPPPLRPFTPRAVPRLTPQHTSPLAPPTTPQLTPIESAPSPIMPSSVRVRRTYLRLDRREQFRPGRKPRRQAVWLLLPACTVAEWRHLYASVGAAWHWHDRDAWSDEQIAERLASENVMVFRVDAALNELSDETMTGVGFVELERYPDGGVEIAYFGLVHSAQGFGLGAWMLQRAVDEAWGMGATHVWLHTCTLDAPQALPNYIARGFVVDHDEEYDVDIR